VDLLDEPTGGLNGDGGGSGELGSQAETEFDIEPFLCPVPRGLKYDNIMYKHKPLDCLTVYYYDDFYQVRGRDGHRAPTNHTAGQCAVAGLVAGG